MTPWYFYQAVLNNTEQAHIITQLNTTIQLNCKEQCTAAGPEWTIFPGILNAPWPQTAGLIVPETKLSVSQSVNRGAVVMPLDQTLQVHLGASTPGCIEVIEWVRSCPPCMAWLPPWPGQPPLTYPETSRFCSSTLQKKLQTVYASLWVTTLFLLKHKMHID